jgi:hypothetical protein
MMIGLLEFLAQTEHKTCWLGVKIAEGPFGPVVAA